MSAGSLAVNGSTSSGAVTVNNAGTSVNYASVFSSVQFDNNSGTVSTAGQGAFTMSGSSLTWTAVPEPSGALAGLLVAAGLLRPRRGTPN